MQPFAHNPTALQAPDGTYLIYHIGCGTPNGGKPCTDCKDGVTGKCRGTGEMVARAAQNPFFSSRFVRRALLTPQVNPGSLYRCGKRD